MTQLHICILSFSYDFPLYFIMGFPSGASGTEPSGQCRLDVRDEGLIPALGRSPGREHGHAL